MGLATEEHGRTRKDTEDILVLPLFRFFRFLVVTDYLVDSISKTSDGSLLLFFSSFQQLRKRELSPNIRLIYFLK
jgi:hypothetical protein